MESSTKILRRMLDERGVEWHDTKIGKGFITVYDHDGITWIVTEHSSGRLSVKGCVKPTQGHYDGMTPAQAIAATLGATDARPTQAESSGTCKLDDFADVPFSVDYEIEGYDMGSFRDYATLAECSACGAYILVPPEYHHVLTCDGDEVYQPYRFCPCCGKKVVEPATNDVDAEVDA